MIIQQENDVQMDGDVQGHDFNMDLDSMGMLFKGFSDNLYSNKIGSIVREITSNCFDAHEELGTKKNVEISMKGYEVISGEQGKITFRDFGVGLSPDRIKNIYSRYFASTKRDSNDQIGGFGIGAKSPLSYTESFEVMTWVDGIEYHYMVFRGQKVPRIDLLSKKVSDEPRGTAVTIPIKTIEDEETFKRELYNQLKYFDNIDYINCGPQCTNDYTIIKGKHFIAKINQKTPLTGVMDMCIGKVAYPIDFEQLGLKQKDSYTRNGYHEFQRTSINLLFNVGDIPVTMNREAVDYGNGVKDKILQKIKDVKNEINDYFLKNLVNEKDVAKYIDQLQDTYSIKVQNYKLDIATGLRPSVSQKKRWFIPKWDKLDNEVYVTGDMWDLFFKKRAVVRQGVKGTSKTDKDLFDLGNELAWTKDKESSKIYRIKGPLTGTTLEYVMEQRNMDNFVFVELADMPPVDSIAKILKLRDDLTYDKVEKVYKYMRKLAVQHLVEKSNSFDDVQVPKEWLKKVEENRVSRYKKSDENFVIRIPRSDPRDSWRMIDTTPKLIYEKYEKSQLLIYGHQNEEDDLMVTKQRLGTIGHNNVFFKIGKANVKFLEGFDRCYHWSKVPQKFFDRARSTGGAFDAKNQFEHSFFEGKNWRELMFHVPEHYRLLRKAFNSNVYDKDIIRSYNPEKDRYDLFDKKTGINYTSLMEQFHSFRMENLEQFYMLEEIKYEGEYLREEFLAFLKQNFKQFKPKFI